jgi:hypothetical protein
VVGSASATQRSVRPAGRFNEGELVREIGQRQSLFACALRQAGRFNEGELVREIGQRQSLFACALSHIHHLSLSLALARVYNGDGRG